MNRTDIIPAVFQMLEQFKVLIATIYEIIQGKTLAFAAKSKDDL